MNLKNKIKDFAVLSSTEVLGTSITAIFWLYLASAITPEEYGEIFFYIGIITIISSISLIATQNTVTVYVAKKIKIQSTLYLLSLVVTCASTLIVIMWFYRIDLGLLVIGYVINTLAIGELLGKKLFKSYSKYALIQKSLIVICGLAFLHFFGSDGILYALSLSYAFYIIVVLRGLKSEKINFPLLKEHVGFISNNYFFSIIQISRSQIDKIIIPTILSFTLLGNYAIALQIMAVLIIIPEIVFKYILPHDASDTKNPKIKLYLILISILVAVLGIILAPYVMPIVFPNYVESITAIQIMCITIIPISFNFILMSKFLGMEKSKHIIISRIISLSIISSGMIILGSLFEITGLAISYFIANTVDTLYLAVFSRRT